MDVIFPVITFIGNVKLNKERTSAKIAQVQLEA